LLTAATQDGHPDRAARRARSRSVVPATDEFLSVCASTVATTGRQETAMGTSTTTLDLAALRGSVRGSVVGPDDAGYDAARDTPFGAADARPLAVVAPAGTDDVAQVVRLAAEQGLELAVRGGGHGAAGYATVDGGIVLDLRSLDGIDIDVAERSVWAGAGLTAAALSTATAEHGLAIGFGDTGSVGIGGITLGGGVGYLVRKHGLTIDNLLAAEVVTAAGDVVVADEQSHPELFWALRGGGGNFGVVTRFRYRLHELGNVYGGMLVLPATAETVTVSSLRPTPHRRSCRRSRT
jgi:FAD/FMN-containing dehydrogenase